MEQGRMNKSTGQGMRYLRWTLGIATVLTNIHIHTAVTHQAVAALLLGAAVWAANSVGAARR